MKTKPLRVWFALLAFGVLTILGGTGCDGAGLPDEVAQNVSDFVRDFAREAFAAFIL